MITPARLAARAVAGALLALLLLAPGALGFEQRDAFTSKAAAELTGAVALAAPPAGFLENVAFSGLQAPTALRFAPNGHVFVAEKAGRILEYDSLADTTPTVFADLRAAVLDYEDRGLLGLEVDPAYASGRPYVYALYTYDKDPSSSTVPRWEDDCPTPPGPTADGCVASGRLSRLAAGGQEHVLIEDWCQQYTSHSIGDLAWGPDGALFVSAGDGASYTFADHGQDGSPVNPCGDPPAGRGGAMTPPTAEGGALRSQDSRTTADPTGADGTILRVNPDTGAALPDNPSAGSADPMTRRIVAQGLRNPFRIAVRPGTSEVWLGDVGWTQWEEINRIPSPTTQVRNFGWPCYEGAGRMSSYDNANLNLCETLYAQGAAAHASPHYTYSHTAKVVSGEACPSGGSSISAIAFYSGTQFPARYRGGLFFADYVRSCIWFMPLGADGQPDPAQRETFATGAQGVVGLTVGPDGSLYYPDIIGGEIKRISFPSANRAPTAVATATPSTGVAPLTVALDGSGSTDPDGDALTYEWDLDGDGQFDDATGAQVSRTYPDPVLTHARLRVTDPSGLTGMDLVTITVGTPPTARIDTPTADFTWAVGDAIEFAGGGVDAGGAPLPASGMRWRLVLQHCAEEGSAATCHTHVIQTWDGVASGSVVAPDHEYPSHLELELTATDADGLRHVVTRKLLPKTVPLTFETSPPGLELSVGSHTGAAPFTRTVIIGSTQSVSAPGPQTLGGSQYDFTGWSDGGAQTHGITAPSAPATYRASFTQLATAGLVGAWGFDEPAGAQALDASGRNHTGAVAGATRATGRFGGALQFDGVDDWVTVADAPALRLSGAMTLEAWVNPAALGARWRTAIMKERGTGLGYALYAHNGGSAPSGFVSTGSADAGTSGGTLPLNTWTHVATTYDGSALRLYVNGAQVATRATTGALATAGGPLRFGGNGAWLDEFFQGRLDEIRVYDRALTAAQIATDMTTPVGNASPPGPTLSVTPASLTYSATQGGANPAAKSLAVANTGGGTLSYSVSDDAPWLSVGPVSGAAPQDVSASVDITGLAPGTHTATITVTAGGAQGSPATIPVTLTVAEAPPTPALAVTPASLAFTAASGGAAPATRTIDVTNAGGGALSFTVADNATWLTVSPASGAAPQSLTVSASQAGLAAGAYSATVTITAPGATGSPKTVPVTLTVSAPPATGGLVAAYGFDEASGATVTDASGAGNPGVVSGATRSAAGRAGGALQFDGVNDWVTVADAASLDLTTGMSLEAWVYPTAAGTTWRTVILKERPAGLAYAIYGNDDTGRPDAFAFTGSEFGARGPSALPLNTWSHVAATYSGTTLRLYVGGIQVATRTAGAALRTSNNPLRIGGNAIWNEWFQGRIDEVRVYNRALTAADIQADMTRPVTTAAVLARKPGARVARRQLRRARRHMSVRLERKRRGLPLRSHKRISGSQVKGRG